MILTRSLIFFSLMSWIVVSTAESAPSKPSKTQTAKSKVRSISADLEEDEAQLSKEEQDFLDEEFSPPQEAPYVDEPAVATTPVPATPSSPQAKPYEPNLKYDQSGLKKVTAKGEYIYKPHETEQSWASRFRTGPFSPPDLQNDGSATPINFEDIYGTSQELMFAISLEYQFISSLGKMGISLGTGFYTARGNGRFKRDPTMVAREEYTFYLAPNSLDLIYYMKYFNNQFLVPYAFGGGYYYTFLETRDDGAAMRYGGAFAANFGGGLALKLDGFDDRARNSMDSDYGINHVYLIGEYEQIVGLNTTYDFSNSLFSGGILVEF